MITQTTEANPTWRVRWISGRARMTMVVSTAVMRTPTTMTSRARPVRSTGSAETSDGAGAAVFVTASLSLGPDPPPGGPAVRTGRHPVGAHVGAGDHVGHPLDVRLRQGLAQELDLARAGLSVAAGHPEDGAVVLGDAPGAVVQSLEVGQVSVLVEDAGQLGDLAGEVVAGQPGPGRLGAAPAATLEGVVDELGGSLREVAQQLVGQLAVGRRKQTVGPGSEPVEVTGASPPTVGRRLLAVGHQPVGGQGGEVLAHGADGEGLRLGQLVGGRLPPPFDLAEDRAAGGR